MAGSVDFDGLMWSAPSGCIGIHTVKIYQARSRQFFGWFVAIFYLSAAVIAIERVLAVRTMRRYGKWSGFSGRSDTNNSNTVQIMIFFKISVTIINYFVLRR